MSKRRGMPGSSLWTVARQTFVQCLRTRVAAVFAVLLIASLALLPALMEGDGTLAGRIKTFLDYSTGVVSVLLALTVILLSAGLISRGRGGQAGDDPVHQAAEPVAIRGGAVAWRGAAGGHAAGGVVHGDLPDGELPPRPNRPGGRTRGRPGGRHGNLRGADEDRGPGAGRGCGRAEADQGSAECGHVGHDDQVVHGELRPVGVWRGREDRREDAIGRRGKGAVRAATRQPGVDVQGASVRLGRCIGGRG